MLSLPASYPETQQPEAIAMNKKSAKLMLTVLVLLGAAPLLGACHTTAGAAEDVSDTGKAVERAADKAAP